MVCRCRILAFLLSVMAAVPAAPAEDPPVADRQLLPSTAERGLFETHLLPLPNLVQVAVAIVQGDSVRFLGAERTKDGLRWLDNRAAVFEIGSITKIFTATLLAQQVQLGALRLDQPASELVPFALKAPGRDGAEVTLKHLASHTSGLCHQPPGLNSHALFHFHAGEPFRDYDRTRFEHFLKDQMALEFTPGSRYQYSNMGMSLVGYILELETGREYESLLQEDIFGPLGMTSSSTSFAKVRDRVVVGVKKEGEAAPNWEMNALAPAGGIKTCAGDFARFVQAQFEPGPAIAMTQESVHRIEDNYFVGLGWHLVDRKNGERWLNHGGGMAGYTAIVNVNVRKKCGVIVLSNLGNAHELAENVSQLGRDLLAGVETQP